MSGSVQISATASPVDAASIEKVEFWLDDDTLLATDTTAPYGTVLDTVGEGVADGVHTIEAIAFEGDSVQNTNAAFRTIIVNNTHTVYATINDARALPDESAVALEGKIVSAVFDGFFYILQSSRIQGIRIVSDVPVSEGNLVTVLGTLRTVDGERRIEAVGVYAAP